MSPGRSGAISVRTTASTLAVARRRAAAGAAVRSGLRSLVQVLKLAEADGLRHAVLGDGEILGGQALDGIAVLVLDSDCLDDQLRVGLKRAVPLRDCGIGCGLLREQAARQRQARPNSRP